MNQTHKILGVLGGLGPMSTFCFCELVTAHTRVQGDRDHIDMLVSSRATTPDRTAFILGKSAENPLPVMQNEVVRLVAGGASTIVIPCNTAHYFYDLLQERCPVPILNIAAETVDFLDRAGIRRFGLLATEGTVFAGTYTQYSIPHGMECVTPDASDQALVTAAIYEGVKKNQPTDPAVLSGVIERLLAKGCQAVVLGCTELSVLKNTLPKHLPICDSLEVLAFRTILACGKEPVGFDAGFFPRRTEP